MKIESINQSQVTGYEVEYIQDVFSKKKTIHPRLQARMIERLETENSHALIF